MNVPIKSVAASQLRVERSQLPRISFASPRLQSNIKAYFALHRQARGDAAPIAVPIEIKQTVVHSNAKWLSKAMKAPLQLQDGGCKVVLLGVCFWAPCQHQLVAEALRELQPVQLLIEQPATSSELLLPHPQWVQTVIDHQLHVQTAAQQEQQQQQWQQWEQQQLGGFKAELLDCSIHAARVGKDLLDPYETFGYYAGMDFLRQPSDTAEVLELCGYLPGLEFVVAAEHALLQGARLSCIDAPIKLQETWVNGLVAGFTNMLDEHAINSYQPLKDFKLNQQVAGTLPAAALAWDKQLADTAAQLQQAAAQESSPDARAAAERQALLLFKVSKATAAALLPPDEQQQAEVLARMQRLQPLKWRHFALRCQHMAQQIKEAASLAAKQAQERSRAGSTPASSSTPTLLVVVGRQHVAALQALWSDPASSLWRTHVPRSFAPSVLEPAGADGAEAAAGNDSAAGPTPHGGRSS